VIDERVWNIGGMMLTGEREVFEEKAVPVSLFTTYSTWTDLR
jgi:hypothetical protein